MKLLFNNYPKIIKKTIILIFLIGFYLFFLKTNIVACTTCSSGQTCNACVSPLSTGEYCLCTGGTPPNYGSCLIQPAVSCCDDSWNCTTDSRDASSPYTCRYTYSGLCWIYTPSTSSTYYNGSGSCGSGGTCYRCSASSTAMSGGGTCASSGNYCSSGSSYCTSMSSCTWTSPLYQYTVSGATTKYTGSGTCSSDGSGSCYKLTSGASYNTSSGSCGGGYCSSSTFYDRSTCTFISKSALNATATLTTSATDLSSSGSITFWVYSIGRTGSFMRFQMGESVSTQHTFPFTISSASTWEQKTWDISGITATSRDAITKYAFQDIAEGIGFTFYFDDIQAVSAAPNAPVGCVILESPTDSYLIPKWSDNSSDENGFQVEKNTDGAGFTFLTNLSAGTTHYQDNSVSSNHTYSYRVRSFTNVGSTEYSDYNTCPTLNLGTGNFNLEGVNLEGLELN